MSATDTYTIQKLREENLHLRARLHTVEAATRIAGASAAIDLRDTLSHMEDRLSRLQWLADQARGERRSYPTGAAIGRAEGAAAMCQMVRDTLARIDRTGA